MCLYNLLHGQFFDYIDPVQSQAIYLNQLWVLKITSQGTHLNVENMENNQFSLTKLYLQLLSVV